MKTIILASLHMYGRRAVGTNTRRVMKTMYDNYALHLKISFFFYFFYFFSFFRILDNLFTNGKYYTVKS